MDSRLEGKRAKNVYVDMNKTWNYSPKRYICYMLSVICTRGKIMNDIVYLFLRCTVLLYRGTLLVILLNRPDGSGLFGTFRASDCQQCVMHDTTLPCIRVHEFDWKIWKRKKKKNKDHLWIAEKLFFLLLAEWREHIGKVCHCVLVGCWTQSWQL